MFRTQPWSFASVLTLTALAAPALAATDEVTEAARRKSVLEALAVPLEVNGVEIPEELVRRGLVYSKGTTLLESLKVDLFIDAEIQRQIEAGAPPEKFDITDAAVDAELEAAEARVREEYPDHSVEEIMAPSGLDRSGLRTQVEQGKLFDTVFLPENPREWPDTTLAAVQSQAGQEFIDKMIEGYELREKTGEQPDPNDAGHQLWKNIMRQFVMKALNDTAVTTPTDELPPEVALEVDGHKLMTDQVFQELMKRNRLSPHDIEQQRLWFAKVEAVEQALKESGHWIGDEEFAEIWEEEEAPYRDSPFNLQVIAVGFRKFPSIDVFRHYFRMLKSYERRIADEINDTNLAAHLDRAEQLLGLGKVQVDALLISAFSFDEARVKLGGWEDAEKRSIEVAEELAEKLTAAESHEEQEAIWDSFMDKYSEFKDAPVAQSQKAQGQAQSLNKGRFKMLHRNELVQSLGESDYSMFLSGSSLTDHVFFTQETGTIDGPFRGPLGYYITKVVARQAPSKSLKLENEAQRDLITQDYLSVRFNAFADEALRAAQVKGLEL